MHATARAFRYRHAWRAGDYVVWDNMATVHAATRLAASSESERVMWRVTMRDDARDEDPAAAARLRERVSWRSGRALSGLPKRVAVSER